MGAGVGASVGVAVGVGVGASVGVAVGASVGLAVAAAQEHAHCPAQYGYWQWPALTCHAQLVPLSVQPKAVGAEVGARVGATAQVQEHCVAQ